MTGPISQDNGGRPISRQCTGHVVLPDGSRRRCRRSADHGATVCGSHGASAPQVKNAAIRRVAEAEAVAAFERYSRPNGDGHLSVAAELGRLIAKVSRFTDFAEARLETLTPDDWQSHNPRTAAEVSMFLRAAREARKLLRDVARLGLEERAQEERQAEICAAQRVGQRVAQCMDRILVALGHQGPRNDPAVNHIVAREIRVMEVGEP